MEWNIGIKLGMHVDQKLWCLVFCGVHLHLLEVHLIVCNVKKFGKTSKLVLSEYIMKELSMGKRNHEKWI